MVEFRAPERDRPARQPPVGHTASDRRCSSRSWSRLGVRGSGLVSRGVPRVRRGKNAPPAVEQRRPRLSSRWRRGGLASPDLRAFSDRDRAASRDAATHHPRAAIGAAHANSTSGSGTHGAAAGTGIHQTSIFAAIVQFVAEVLRRQRPAIPAAVRQVAPVHHLPMPTPTVSFRGGRSATIVPRRGSCNPRSRWRLCVRGSALVSRGVPRVRRGKNAPPAVEQRPDVYLPGGGAAVLPLQPLRRVFI